MADYGFQSTSVTGGLTIAEGSSQILFSVNLVAAPGSNVLANTDVAEILSAGPDTSLISFFDELFSPIPTTVAATAQLTPAIDPNVIDVIISSVGGIFPGTRRSSIGSMVVVLEPAMVWATQLSAPHARSLGTTSIRSTFNMTSRSITSAASDCSELIFRSTPKSVVAAVITRFHTAKI